jgi:hypothetical protein
VAHGLPQAIGREQRVGAGAAVGLGYHPVDDAVPEQFACVQTECRGPRGAPPPGPSRRSTRIPRG